MISQGSEEMEVGDIIQITKEDHSWFGCLLMVSEVKSWGVQAFVAIPCRNDRREVNRAYIRLNADEFELVGKAVMIPQDEIVLPLRSSRGEQRKLITKPASGRRSEHDD